MTATDTAQPLAQAPTITAEPHNGGRLLTCPSGHTYWHKGTPAAEVLAPWIAGHEEHEEDT